MRSGERKGDVGRHSSEPAVIPVQAVCGELQIDGASMATYTTRIDVTYRPTDEDAESGEIVVSPDIVAGEVNPGETIVIGCEDILQGRQAFQGIITVQTLPSAAFTVQVTYRALGT